MCTTWAYPWALAVVPGAWHWRSAWCVALACATLFLVVCNPSRLAVEFCCHERLNRHVYRNGTCRLQLCLQTSKRRQWQLRWPLPRTPTEAVLPALPAIPVLAIVGGRPPSCRVVTVPRGSLRTSQRDGPWLPGSCMQEVIQRAVYGRPALTKHRLLHSTVANRR